MILEVYLRELIVNETLICIHILDQTHGYGSSDKTHVGGGSVDTGTCMQW